MFLIPATRFTGIQNRSLENYATYGDYNINEEKYLASLKVAKCRQAMY